MDAAIEAGSDLVSVDAGKMNLRDPETCPRGHAKPLVLDSRKRKGFRRKLLKCRICGAEWPAFFSLIDPRKVTIEPRTSI